MPRNGTPLSRAHETAQLVGEHFDLQVHKTYPELVERAYGAGEGLDIPAPERRAIVEDLFWALMTSREFLFQH